MSDEETGAVNQSAMLLELTSHLADHPHLAPVNILYPERLQVADHSQQSYGASLVDWADTLAGSAVEVRRINEQAFTYVHGSFADHDVTVWAVVDGLAHAMGADAFTGGGEREQAWITVDDLREYVRHGTAPAPELVPA